MTTPATPDGAEKLERWGFPNGINWPAAMCDDGYWTPWHVAQASIDCLQSDLRYAHREMEAIWDDVQRVSPWSPSNDMLWSDEVATGIHFLLERAESAERDAKTIRAALEQREAEVAELKERVAFNQRGWDGAVLQALENGQAARVAESRLGEAERLLRDIKPALACEDTYNPCTDLRNRIADFFKGVEGG